MPKVENSEKLARKLLPIIYVVDTSGSMQGDKIASVNNAMEETMQVLKDVSASNPDAETRVGVLTFSSGTKWFTNGIVSLEEYYWNNIDAGGVTDLGDAIKELNKRMSRSDLLSADDGVGYNVPVLIFMTDGQPTDNWEKELNKALAENKWFKASTKIGIAIGDDADTEVLKKVVGNVEAIIKVTDNETLKKLIKVVSVSASLVNSKSRVNSEQDTATEIIENTMNTMNEEKVEQVTDNNTNQPDPQPQPQPDPDPGFDDGFGGDDWN